MTDPLALVAFGAAVGGFAGKFGEKTWDLAERWVARRYENHAPAAQASARTNSASFILALAKRVTELEGKHAEIADRVNAAQSDPHFSLVLQKAILGSAQTSEPAKHQLLADLVASRLLADTETTLSLAIGLACDAVPNLTYTQLHWLALLVFLHELRPRNKYESKASYIDWVRMHLGHFDDIEFRDIDIRHLVALGCVTYDPTSARSLPMLLTMKNGVITDELMAFDDFVESNACVGLKIAWDEGLAGVDLTSVGSVIGGHVWSALTGHPSGLPSWAGDEGV
jgi:GGDEF domain-containing protein